ncbi:MAG: integrase [Clostridia bacterium]|jgi:site-specific recombinase XerD|nr:integrase [Clostridia bacterium]
MKKKQESYAGISLQARHLAEYISEWINIYVPRMRGCSSHTERAYRTSLSLYVSYLEEKGYTPFTLSIECFTPEVLNNWFLWLRDNRNLKPTSCNGRMGAIKCMLKYIGGRDVAFAGLYLKAKEYVKRMREGKVHIMGMTKNAVRALFAAPDTTTKLGVRDLFLMLMCYGVAGRIDEILSLKVKDLRTEVKDPYAILHGKGSKIRSVYLQLGIIKWYERYIKLFHEEAPNQEDYLFYSTVHGQRCKLTQPAVSKRMKLHADKARLTCNEVPNPMHAHLWRHTAACHWRENGINIVEIKELMGHASLTSTMVYQDVTDDQKKEAIKSLENNVTQTMKKKWTMPENRSLTTMFGINVD